ncbi:MAG: hypothetical protein LIP23_00400, partial [Planctomycetes bacterium]|nr:hypothetical protein [Planctomycetota bacterium]
MFRFCATLLFVFTITGASFAGEGKIFRFELGGMKIVALLDNPGGGTLRPDLLIGLDEEQQEKYLVPGSMD